jgi:hypothetical protein
VNRSIRFSIAGLMGTVLIAALVMAALISDSAAWAGATLLATCGVLGLAVVGVVCGGANERAWWLGFALFGWGYMALAFRSPDNSATLPTLTLLKAGLTKMGWTDPGGSPPPPMRGGSGGMGGQAIGDGTPPFDQTGHCLWALVAAGLGGMLARFLFAIPSIRSEQPAAEVQPAEKAPRILWRRLAVIGLMGFALVTFAALAVAGITMRLWASVTWLLTCGLFGFAVLGALISRGRHREVCLGAGLFGFGYLFLALGLQPHWPTSPQVASSQFLEHIRPWLPSSLSDFPITPDRTSPANARVLQELERPIRMHFPEETPLEDVLQHVKKSTKGADGKGISIYVDPIGLQEAERSMSSTVHIDLEGVPLRTSLQLCLKQLGLTYVVKDGVVLITSIEESLPAIDDPYMIVGHCLFAMIAAIAGAAAAPLVAGGRAKT